MGKKKKSSSGSIIYNNIVSVTGYFSAFVKVISQIYRAWNDLVHVLYVDGAEPETNERIGNQHKNATKHMYIAMCFRFMKI